MRLLIFLCMLPLSPFSIAQENILQKLLNENKEQFGDKKKEEQIPPNIRIFNKVGWAYGFLTDIAYIVDFEAGVESFLATTIHVNEDGIYNDNNYEYDSIGLPFLSKLGSIIYEHEKKRPRKYRADLSKFNIQTYD